MAGAHLFALVGREQNPILWVICGVQKSTCFWLGLWQLDDKIAFFALGFFRIWIWFIKPKSSQICSFFAFFEWPFSNKFYINWNPPVLWLSNGKTEKSQFLDVAPRGKCYLWKWKWEGKQRVSIHRKPCWPFVPNSNGLDITVGRTPVQKFWSLMIIQLVVYFFSAFPVSFQWWIPRRSFYQQTSSKGQSTVEWIPRTARRTWWYLEIFGM